MRMRLCCLCVAVLSMAAVPCMAAGPSWDGTWKLDQAKSHMTGATFTIIKNGEMYTFTNGSIRYKFACDGKDYTIVPGRTAACTMTGNSIHWVYKADGKEMETSNDELSSDGRTWTSVASGTRADGAHYTDRETDERVGAGNGLAGTWNEAKVSSSAASIVQIRVAGNVLHAENLGTKGSYDAKLDGTPAALTGGDTPPGVTVSAKSEGQKISLVTMLNGKKVYTDEWSVSPDGKVLTDVGWSPGQEANKQIYIYTRE